MACGVAPFAHHKVLYRESKPIKFTSAFNTPRAAWPNYYKLVFTYNKHFRARSCPKARRSLLKFGYNAENKINGL